MIMARWVGGGRVHDRKVAPWASGPAPFRPAADPSRHSDNQTQRPQYEQTGCTTGN